MAGGKASARQKMINLMYLVFIAMMAMNMSKEVLSAFGLMNEKFTVANEATDARNESFMAGLAEKVSEQPAKYQPLKGQADQIETLSNELDTYIEDLKGKMLKGIEDRSNYEAMDNTAFLDEYFFTGDALNRNGKAFVAAYEKYRDGVVEVLSGNPDMADISASVTKAFNTEEVTNKDGKKIKWLDYHYKGYPLVASLTKLTSIQSDIKTTQSEVLSSMLGSKLQSEVSLSNFEAIVVPAKTAFFSGENFQGTIILGKKDNTLSAHKVVINGTELAAEAMQAGKTILDFPAGAVGEREITGEFQFKEGDSIVKIAVNSSYAVVPKPNSATISADKMNVVYRGVDNPMTISFAGISDNNVTASAPGLKKAGKGYVMRPTSGREVTINVKGILADGKAANDQATFRIKDIPAPTGAIRGEMGLVKMQRNSLEISTISAELPGFDFDLKLNVSGFKFKVPGQPTINVSGKKLDSRAKAALRKAKRGDAVQVFDIQAKIANNPTKLKKVAPVFIELTN
ncbi:MAG: gliding motility protein GldM [Bacteroidetes bacterium MedPE-SWsnd-G2]|nr:MAG: gliding motility protein GldM [Bacteroidetes bacterium MedPE-SWsnd-G2]